MSNFRLFLSEATLKGVTKARARIFGHVLNPTGQPSGIKNLRKNLVDEKVVAWRLSKLEMQKRREKSAPKKGQGRHALKRNK
ncbi:hypothetical protein MKX03_014421 [Papaver bracteatum]|nr:hypothetical protein MKX03_014421 [Papaver bracteatum]